MFVFACKSCSLTCPIELLKVRIHYKLSLSGVSNNYSTSGQSSIIVNLSSSAFSYFSLILFACSNIPVLFCISLGAIPKSLSASR